MREALPLLLAWMAGGALGAIFFGGLWWTVSKGVSSPCPARWFLSSMLLRTGAVVAGFYYIGAGHLPRLLVCLLGFVMVRLAVMWLTRLPREKQSAAREVHHAP
jgi:F1F0 ATPase subunit 2